MMFGPSDADSIHSSQSFAWKIKRYGNDELRQKFIDQAVPQAEVLGLKIPDDDLQWDAATGHYRIGAIDWDEFQQVVSGNGPCSRQRLAHHRQVQEDGAWVREAVAAHAAKHRAGSDGPKAAARNSDTAQQGRADAAV